MDKPVRILHVVMIMNAGGIENMLMNLYRSIDRTKIQFDFLVHRTEKGFFDDEIQKLGGNIYHIMPLQVHKIFAYQNQLNDFFSQHKGYKIIHSHISIYSYFILKKANKNCIPVRIAHSHEAHQSIWEHKKQRIPIIWTLKKVINKPLTHRFACGIDAGNWLFGRNQNFIVLNNAIDASLFTYNREDNYSLKAEFMLSDSIVFGHVGRFFNQKNHSFLIDVFYEINKKDPMSKLVLIGDGELKENIEKKVVELGIKNNVLFLGVRNNIHKLLQMIDAIIMPSFFEGLPVTLVEAQAAGLKIFASDTITDEVALTDDITFLSLDKSPEFWAEQILNSFPYERKNNCEIIKEKGYDIVESAKKLEEFYLNQISLLEE